MTTPIIGPTVEYPHRPSHLDFDVLSALIIALDGEADDAGKDFDLNAVTGRYVDPESLAYLAMQRAIRALHITTAAEVASHTDEVIKLSVMYHDGFIMGCRFWQTKGGKNRKSGDPRKRGTGD